MLYVNPAQNQTLYLWCDGKEYSQPYPQAEQMLQAFDSILPDTKQIDHIVFVNDAGTFTTVRILAAICNALAATSQAKIYVIQSPVDVAELNTIIATVTPVSVITPHYASEPNISLPKAPSQS